jgi:hypothetical protein
MLRAAAAWTPARVFVFVSRPPPASSSLCPGLAFTAVGPVRCFAVCVGAGRLVRRCTPRACVTRRAPVSLAGSRRGPVCARGRRVGSQRARRLRRRPRPRLAFASRPPVSSRRRGHAAAAAARAAGVPGGAQSPGRGGGGGRVAAARGGGGGVRGSALDGVPPAASRHRSRGRGQVGSADAVRCGAAGAPALCVLPLLDALVSRNV